MSGALSHFILSSGVFHTVTQGSLAFWSNWWSLWGHQSLTSGGVCIQVAVFLTWGVEQVVSYTIPRLPFSMGF